MASLISTETREWITGHRDEDPVQLSLRFHGKGGTDYKFAIEQIRAYQKARKKIPEWALVEGIVWPPVLSIEQSTSEAAAKFKASIFKGSVAIDLTGGMGVDTYYLSQSFQKVYYVEKDDVLCRIARYNFDILGARNITVINERAEDYLSEMDQAAELIYIDPSRRNQHKKVFQITDASPNIHDILPALKNKARDVLIKLSPFLDIQSVTSDLPGIRRLFVLGVDNECKELLCHIGRTEAPPTIEAVNIHSANSISEKVQFTVAEEQGASAVYSAPLEYLYEPNAPLLKAGAFNYLAEAYQLNKLHRNTHLYTSNTLRSFPGSVYRIERISAYQSKTLDNGVNDEKFTIRIRNFPDTIHTIKKKLGIKEGDDKVLFAVTLHDNKPALLVCARVSA